MAQPTPTTLGGFTPDWLTEELRRSGTIGSDTSVVGVEQEILGQGEGFMGDLARLTLTYEGDPGPPTAVAKIPTQTELNRATGRSLMVYEREVKVYAEVLPQIDIPLPRVYSAIYEATGDEHELLEQMVKADRLPIWALRRIIRRQQSDSYVPPCVLLLEDLSEARVGDQVTGGTSRQVEAGLRVLARLHAATWHRRLLTNEHWLQSANVIPRVFHAGYTNGRKQFEREVEPLMSAHAMRVVRSVRKTGLARSQRLHQETPACLLHGDYRLDNMFFDADDTIAAVIDWQASNPGPAVIDVAYFVVSSLRDGVSTGEVDELLSAYHDELVANGVDDYGIDQFMADYIEGLLVIVHRMPMLVDGIDLGDGRGVALMETWIRRLGARLERVPA